MASAPADPQPCLEMVRERIGLRICDRDRDAFGRVVGERIGRTGCGSEREYRALLASDTAAGRQEWRLLAERLTTGESFFFRDGGLFRLLRHVLLPERIAARQESRTLRIWSAGCSTGEEPYSLAMLLDAHFPGLAGWEVTILGTDINEAALERARAGLYGDWSFRRVGEELLRRYFTRQGELWQIGDRIRRMVRFLPGNLNSDAPPIGDIDLLFCRNVFIYFESGAVADAVERCRSALAGGGYLVAGHGELFGLELPWLERRLYPEAVVYRKGSVMRRPVDGSPAEPHGEQRREGEATLPGSGEGGADLHGTAAIKAPNAGPSLPRGRPGSVSTAGRKEPPATGTPPPRNADRSPREGAPPETAASAARKHDAAQLADLLAAARGHADAGEYGQAAEACQRAVALAPLSADPHLLLAQLAEARGDDAAAKECLRRVIYLDPGCIAAHLELGGLHEKGGEHRRAAKMRRTALELLRSLPAAAAVPPYDACAGELLSYLEAATGEASARTPPGKGGGP